MFCAVSVHCYFSLREPPRINWNLDSVGIALEPKGATLCHGPDRRTPNRTKRETPLEGGLLNSNLMIVDQAAINAGFDFRRWAMKPMPAKPRSSIVMWMVRRHLLVINQLTRIMHHCAVLASQ